MIRKSLLTLLSLLLLVSLCACELPHFAPKPTEEPAAVVKVTPEPEKTVDAQPASVLSGVETEKKVVSLVVEGFSDSDTTRALAEVLADSSVPAVFFISGKTADEYPELVREIAEKGFRLGNYGMNGAKKLEAYSPYQNALWFQHAQSLIEKASGKLPELARCNGTLLTDGVLRAVRAGGLTAVVEPTVFLNHRSFDKEEDAAAFVLGLPRGSILSIKLGQELDADEYGEPGEKLDKRPAIDPTPGIRWGMSLEDARYASLPDIAQWIVEALLEDGYQFVTPEELSAMGSEYLPKTGNLTLEQEKLLNENLYILPVTQSPLSAGSFLAGQASDFRSAVIVGDTVIEGLSDYVAWRRKTDPNYYYGLTFVTEPDLTVESLLKKGDAGFGLEDRLAMLKARSVWLCLDFSTPSGTGKESSLANYRLLLSRILKKNPDIRIVILPALPRAAGHDDAGNMRKFRRELALCRMCLTYDLDFVDAAYPLRDASGALREEYCLDQITYGRLLNDPGCEVLLDYLTEHVPK